METEACPNCGLKTKDETAGRRRTVLLIAPVVLLGLILPWLLDWTRFTNRTPDSSAINIKSFGAIGDGASDDTRAILAAIAHADSTGRFAVYFPAGDYKFSRTIRLSNFISLIGDGVDVSILRYTGSGSAISINGTARDQIVKNQITGFSIYGNPAATDGLLLNYASYSRFDNLRFYRFTIGVLIEHSWLNTFTGVIAEACQQDGFNLGTNANSNALIHCSATTNARSGFFIEGVRGGALTDCNAELNGINIYICASKKRPTEKITVMGGYFEGAKTESVFITSTDDGVMPKAVTIRDAYFVALVEGTVGVRVRECDTLVVDGCHFSRAGKPFGYSLYLQDNGTVSQIVWGAGNLDESINGKFAGINMAYSSVHTNTTP
jgi:hypothetical protein